MKDPNGLGKNQWLNARLLIVLEERNRLRSGRNHSLRLDASRPFAAIVVAAVVLNIKPTLKMNCLGLERARALPTSQSMLNDWFHRFHKSPPRWLVGLLVWAQPLY